MYNIFSKENDCFKGLQTLKLQRQNLSNEHICSLKIVNVIALSMSYLFTSRCRIHLL